MMFLYWQNMQGTVVNNFNLLTHQKKTLSKYCYPNVIFFFRYYKAIQSAGSAISWRIDVLVGKALVEFLICWILLTISLPCAYVVVSRIKDTSDDVNNITKEKGNIEIIEAN